MQKLCECGCGNPTPIATRTRATYVKGEGVRFCLGHGGKGHGETRTVNGKLICSPENDIYRQAKGRCTNPNDQSWKDYGGRGIEFRFTSFEQFLAAVGRRPDPSLSVDRINNDGHYEQGNLRWATQAQQHANRRPRRKRDN